MKTLDRYIAKNFLLGYIIAFGVLMGLRIIIDLFVNLDEFTERADMGTLQVIINITTYYALNCTLYFLDFAGIITVLAAVFSIGKMVRSNEFVAMMASGVSLKRVIAPIVLLSVIMTGLLVIDQEFIIPPLSDRLVCGHDEIPGKVNYRVRFMTDGNGSLIFSPRFNPETATLYNLTILTRQRIKDTFIWEPIGRISADKATYNPVTETWDLANAYCIGKDSNVGPGPITTYKNDLKPRDIPVRLQAEYKTLLSWSQLDALQRQGSNVKDLPQLYSQKHFRIIDPIINLVMLMVCLPVLVCRDPKSMKTAVMIGFTLSGTCMIAAFACKMLAAEAVLNRVELWAWLPVFIFLPIALVQIDSMKT
jgi:lipopolysaccharide export system permease protein